MEPVLFLAGIAAWTVRAARRWSGWWRVTAVAPAAAVTVVGYRREPAGDSFWWLWSIALLVVAAVLAYILHEVHQAKVKRRGIPTAPPNVR